MAGLVHRPEQAAQRLAGHRAEIYRGQVGLTEAERAWTEPEPAGLPVAEQQVGIGQRCRQPQDRALAQAEIRGDGGERKPSGGVRMVPDVAEQVKRPAQRGRVVTRRRRGHKVLSGDAGLSSHAGDLAAAGLLVCCSDGH